MRDEGCSWKQVFGVLWRLALSLVLAGGCASPGKGGKSGQNPRSDIIQLTGFWQPYLLYLQAAPHTRLWVEVDAVEGTAPDDTTLKKLKEFLAALCDKPDGVEVVRGDVIPREQARGIPPRALARKYLNGPPRKEGGAAARGDTAFIYLLYYDGVLSAQRPATGPQDKKRRNQSRHEKPWTDLIPYPAISYINVRHAPKQVGTELLLHEAGHLLGLARQPGHAADHHCLDENCLLNQSIRLSRIRMLFGFYPTTQTGLCPACLAELEHNRHASPVSNLRFIGPVLVRSEAGYHVLSLPHRLLLILGELEESDGNDFAEAVRSETQTATNDDDVKMKGEIKDALMQTPDKLQTAIVKAKNDPFKPVRDAAAKLEQLTGASKAVGESP